ncbi:hypothetical protein [Streptomyces sp. NPDC102360]|uniref:hypothetical protein n=1 Tax=Streptomyces sp. NPDC102360 TaxID=3366160 RepID=UPI003801B103
MTVAVPGALVTGAILTGVTATQSEAETGQESSISQESSAPDYSDDPDYQDWYWTAYEEASAAGSPEAARNNVGNIRGAAVLSGGLTEAGMAGADDGLEDAIAEYW